MQLEHARIFRDYSATFDAQVVQTWEALIAVWDEDPESHLDPYEEPQNGMIHFRSIVIVLDTPLTRLPMPT